MVGGRNASEQGPRYDAAPAKRDDWHSDIDATKIFCMQAPASLAHRRPLPRCAYQSFACVRNCSARARMALFTGHRGPAHAPTQRATQSSWKLASADHAVCDRRISSGEVVAMKLIAIEVLLLWPRSTKRAAHRRCGLRNAPLARARPLLRPPRGARNRIRRASTRFDARSPSSASATVRLDDSHLAHGARGRNEIRCANDTAAGLHGEMLRVTIRGSREGHCGQYVRWDADPNIVSYLESFHQGQDLWIAMEFCGGGSISDLSQILGNSPHAAFSAAVRARLLRVCACTRMRLFGRPAW